MNDNLKILSVDLAKKNKKNKESPLENNNDLKVFIINGSGGSGKDTVDSFYMG